MTVTVDLTVHPLDAALRTCHAFTARCNVSTRRDGDLLLVELSDDAVASDFQTALLDYTLRGIISSETRAIRELLVAQAFCEASFLDRREADADEYDDPRGICVSR